MPTVLKNTDRETYRIIKNSFDKIGNQIEANKYFSHEMDAHGKALKKLGFSSERLLFSFNKIISNFGSSYKRPLFLMFLSTVFYNTCAFGVETNWEFINNFLSQNCWLFDDYWLYEIRPESKMKIKFILSILNEAAKGVPPYGRFLKEGLEFVNLMYYIIFLTLTWHFIIAVKRHTKR